MVAHRKLCLRLRRQAAIRRHGPHPDALVAVRSDLRSAAEDSDVGLRANATAPGIESSSPGIGGQCGTHHRLRGGLA